MDIGEVIGMLDGLSLFAGAAVGLLAGLLVALVSRFSMSRSFEQALAEQKSTFDEGLNQTKSAYETATREMKSSFESLSNEALLRNQQEFFEVAKGKFDDQEKQHSVTLESKKQLIDQQLQSMSKSMTETLKTVPTELEKNQTKVAEVVDKSAETIKESNKSYLDQLTAKAETQTKEHNKELDNKKVLIDQRLTDMDVKLGKVERLVQELQTDRKAQYGALGQQLQSLTATTSSLQTALADNRARGQWGERIAEDILRLLGFVEGVNYVKQATTDEGKRPDFTFPLANQLSLHMDCKFPINNYLKYVEADNDKDRKEYTTNFLRNIKMHITDITKRDYINAQTVDCVLIFIANEQIYRFINEQDSSVIDMALKHKVILCSPITLYVVLAVIRQAAMNFTIEQRSREIVAVVNEVRNQWGEYTKEMTTLGNHISRANNKFEELLGVRTRELDRRFNNIDGLLENTDLRPTPSKESPQLPKETT